MPAVSIAEYAAQIVADWPPLTELQKAELSRILAATAPKVGSVNARPAGEDVPARRAA